MKVFLPVILLMCALGSTAYADIIRTEDGTVYIGKVAAADGNRVTLDAYGRKIQVAAGTIISTETEKTSLQSESLEIHLKDGSVIKGRITDYDQDIGLLIDVEFGSLTIPFENVSSIENPQQRNRYIGPPAQAGLAAGYFWPVGSLASPFGSGWTVSASAEFNLQLVRGLYAGVEMTQFFLGYNASPDVSYGITTPIAGPMYRLLMLRTSPLSYLNLLVPWASLGGGVAYVSVQDRRVGANQSAYGELDPVWCAGIGVDAYPLEWLIIRLSARWLAVQQKQDLLHLPAIALGAAYSF